MGRKECRPGDASTATTRWPASPPRHRLHSSGMLTAISHDFTTDRAHECGQPPSVEERPALESRRSSSQDGSEGARTEAGAATEPGGRRAQRGRRGGSGAAVEEAAAPSSPSCPSSRTSPWIGCAGRWPRASCIRCTAGRTRRPGTGSAGGSSICREPHPCRGCSGSPRGEMAPVARPRRSASADDERLDSAPRSPPGWSRRPRRHTAS